MLQTLTAARKLLMTDEGASEEEQPRGGKGGKGGRKPAPGGQKPAPATKAPAPPPEEGGGEPVKEPAAGGDA